MKQYQLLLSIFSVSYRSCF
uniref:Uncharacterized protein n=1 Tax=Rhizophora mucronata TaxID=61149 RepID=A0A2P2MC15_RHIMU